MLPPELQRIEVTPGMFITRQHYEAWISGHPMRHLKEKRGAVRQKYRDIVFRAYRHRCVHCGAMDQLTFGHIVPWIFGGSDQPCNGRAECLPCNVKQFTPAMAAMVEDATCRRDGTSPAWAVSMAAVTGQSSAEVFAR